MNSDIPMTPLPVPEPTRAFKGVWIPRSLWERDDLSWFEKCLLAEIESFTSDTCYTCYASNAYLAKVMRVSLKSIEAAFTKFRKMNLVITTKFDGRRRDIILARNISCDSGTPLESKGGTPRILGFPTLDFKGRKRKKTFTSNQIDMDLNVVDQRLDTSLDTSIDPKSDLPPAGRRGGVKNVVFDALVKGCSMDPSQLTISARRTIGVAAAEIRSVRPNCTEADVLAAIAAYKAQRPTWALTPSAIAKHWGSLVFVDLAGFPANVREQMEASRNGGEA